MSKLQIETRLNNLRALFKDYEIDAYYVPRSDAFQNEYVPLCNERLKFISNFSGSAGNAIIAKDKAAFFTDGRYTLQAISEIPDKAYEIYSISPDQKPLSTVKPTEWILGKLPQGARLGFDPYTITPAQFDVLSSAIKQINGQLVSISGNLIDKIWTQRPDFPSAPVICHEIRFAGIDHQDKINGIAKKIESSRCSALILTFPEDIAWLLNIRGHDVDYNPLPLCYGILYCTREMDLFIHPEKMTTEIQQSLGANIRIHNFDHFEKALSDLRGNQDKVWIDPQTTPYQVKTILSDNLNRIYEAQNPIQITKARKNETEIHGAIQAHIRDGLAVTRFLYRLSNPNYVAQNSEITASDDLENLRKKNDLFKGLSFPTISGAGPDGAIIHYRADKASDKPLSSGPLYLCDSGGQYLDGTTDITRTISVDTPSDEMRKNFTLVLKGMIQVSKARFPKGTTGKPLDDLARTPLNTHGLNYPHGTGHGVGSYLCVHEGPCGIHARAETPLLPGMILSNEPGYYKNGEYGIRIENLVLVQDTGQGQSDGKPIYSFKTLTMAPIDIKCIDVHLMDADEIEWLNAYHREVYHTLKPHLETIDPDACTWLKTVTEPL